MADQVNDDFFTARHNRLTTIAKFANITGWIVLIAYAFFLVVGTYQSRDLFTSLSFHNLQVSGVWAIMQNLWSDLSQNGYEGIHIIVSALQSFLQGVAAFLLLIGLSLGLRMIVETDLNYKEKYQRVNHEQ